MSDLAQYLIAIGTVFAVNLLPAFGPPTWALLVFFSLQFDLPKLPLVLGGALAAALGRLLLAYGARRVRPRLSEARRARLDRAHAAVSGERRRTIAGLALFAVSPVPSGQLFVAAGLMSVRLVPLTVAFFAGRLVSYAIYVSAATIAERSLGGIALDALTSPVGIALQIAMLVALAMLLGGFRPGEQPEAGGPRDRVPEAPGSHR